MALTEPAHSSWLEAEPLFWCPVRELELKCRPQAENEDLEGGNGAQAYIFVQWHKMKSQVTNRIKTQGGNTSTS